MKRSLIAALLCCIACSTAVAQGVNRGGFALYGGLLAAGNKSSENQKDSRTGYNAGVSLEFALSRMATFRASVDYSNVPFDGETFVNSTDLKRNGIESIEGDPAKVLMVFGSLEIYFKENRRATSAYLVLGAGYLGFSMENITFRINGYHGTFRQDVELQTLALQVGVGVEFPMSDGASFFVETSLCAAFGKTQVIPFIPVKGGLRVRV
jgi:hypothetical protein